MEVQRGVAATLRFPEYGDDTVTLSTPTVTVTRDSDGTTLVDHKEATAGEEDQFYTYDLKGAEIPQVDLLRVTWADEASTYEQLVEVVGGFACSIEAIKKKLGDTEGSPPADEEIARQREIATRDIEGACWDAFRLRYARETLSGDNGRLLILNQRRVKQILSLSVNGEIYTESEISELAITEIGLERNPYEWPYGFGSRVGWLEGRNNIVVRYVYGHENYPSAANPVRDLAADYLVQHPTDWEERATSYTDTDGNNYRMVTAGERGNRFNIPSVNAFVQTNEALRIL